MIAERPTEASTRDAFNAAAPVYDSEYEHLHGIQRLRSIISKTFLEYFAPGQNLLELNCGTGTDAVFLGSKGIHVLATDLSQHMLAETKRKIHSLHLEGFVATRELSYLDLHLLDRKKFDGAYSNMGGINCTNEMKRVATSLAPLITAGGYFVAVVMPEFCLWETVAFLARLQLRDAFRRRRANGVSAHLHGGRVQTVYYSPKHFASFFAPHFECVDLMGLNILTPPPNSTNAYARMPRLIRILERIDDRIARLPVFPSIGDQYLIVLRRKSP